MAKRKTISKRQRFEIFKRDGFACRYCGNTPSTSVLHVDHIQPVSEGGDNSPENLVTACETCNLGKGAKLLGDALPDLDEKAMERVREQSEQLSAYAGSIREQAEIRDDMMDFIAGRVCARLFDSGKQEVVSNELRNLPHFVDHLGLAQVENNATISAAQCRTTSPIGLWRYFCAVCWNQIRGEKEPAN